MFLSTKKYSCHRFLSFTRLFSILVVSSRFLSIIYLPSLRLLTIYAVCPSFLFHLFFGLFSTLRYYNNTLYFRLRLLLLFFIYLQLLPVWFFMPWLEPSFQFYVLLFLWRDGSYSFSSHNPKIYRWVTNLLVNLLTILLFCILYLWRVCVLFISYWLYM